MAKTSVRNIEAVRAEAEQVKAQVRTWETEASSLSNVEPPDWEACQDPAVLEQFIEHDRRRATLPLQIRAGKIRAAELELEALGLELAAQEEEVTAAHAAWEPVNERLREAQEAERQARGAWHDARYRVGDIRREKTAKERELHALVNEPPPEQRGVVVRSLWQDNIRPNPDDPGFGTEHPTQVYRGANVNDTPLSAQEGAQQPVPVIPEKALKASKTKRGGG